MKQKTTLLAFLALAAITLPSGAATLIHRYSFGTDGAVEDTATGGTTGGPAVRVDGTLTGGATVSGGSLITTGQAGGSAYASIPSAATAGLTGSFSIQQFATPVFAAGLWQTLSIFTLPGSDNNGGTQNNILIATPVRGENNYPSAYGYWQTGVNGGNQEVLRGTSGDSGGLEHIFTTTFDATSGTASFYFDGVLAASSTNLTGFNLSLLSNIGINGRSPFGDASLTGSTTEFRIYSGALTASEVAATSANADLTSAQFEALGVSVSVPEASSAVMAMAALGAGLTRRRRESAR